jgi:hypothetical protein
MQLIRYQKWYPNDFKSGTVLHVQYRWKNEEIIDREILLIATEEDFIVLGWKARPGSGGQVNRHWVTFRQGLCSYVLVMIVMIHWQRLCGF